MGLFDNVFQGGWNENSYCGFNKKCKKTKEVISNVCQPLRSTYGEYTFEACVGMAQNEPYPQSPEDVLCIEPQRAFDVWGVVCPEYDETKTTKKGEVFGINVFYILAVVVFIISIYLILK